MAGLTFRKAVPEDLPQMYQMAEDGVATLPYGIPWKAEDGEAYIDTFMGPDKSAFIIERDGLVLAAFGVTLGNFWFNSDHGFARVSWLYTRPEARRMGAGKMIMEAMRWLLANYNVEFSFDSGGKVDAKDRFFRRFGFERVGHNYIARKQDDGR